ncbi:11273_t:CDS:1, partial [Cetraspora pellucida]
MPEFNQDNESENFRKIIDVLVMPLQTGSEYYWKHQNLYINKKNSQYIGCAMAHLGCTQKLERKYTKSNEQLIKRVSEVRPAIECYLCNGTITIKIDLYERHAKISIKHLITYEHPTYRETNLL